MSTQAAAMLQYQYEQQLRLQAQQQTSKLEYAVTRGPAGGERTRHDYVGKVTAVERTARHQDSPYVDTPHDDRWSVARNFGVADLVDNFDRIRTRISDPQMRYAATQMAAMKRQIDMLVVDCIGGTAITGQTGTGTQALPSAQKVSVTSHTYDEGKGTGNCGLGYWKILEAIKILEEQYGDVTGRVHGTLFAREKNTLIATTKASSSLYVGPEALAFKTGQISSYLGVQWHLMAEDAVNTDGSSNRLIYIWLEDQVFLDVNEDITTEINRVVGKWKTWEVLTDWTMGCVRGDDKAVAEIACHPTTLF